MIAQLVKNPPAIQETLFQSWFRKIHWRRDRLPTPGFLGFPCGSAGEEAACKAEDLGSIPGLGRSPEEGKGYPLQCSGLENSIDCIVHGVAKSRTQLSDFCLSTICNQLCLLIGEGNDPLTPLQYSCLENSMVGGAWRAAVHGVAKSQT